MHGGGGESVREHRNYLFQVARHEGGGKRVQVRKGPSAWKCKVKIVCKDMEGWEKSPSTERIRVHGTLKSKSAELGQEGPLRSDGVVRCDPTG